ncbi:MAG: heterodisulfide reductase-related iron-sulfur binding cluster [Dehalococcoidia bacterium]
MTTGVSSRKRSGFNYAAYFREIRLLHDLTTPTQDRRWRAGPPTQDEPHDIVLYLGCNVLRTSHMVRTVTALLDLLGVDYVAVGGPSYCCGIVHHRNGDTDIANTLGLHAIRSFQRFHPQRLVMWCPSCIFYYDEIFQMPLPFPVQHVAEFLVEHLGELRFTQEVRERVALHHHCDRPRRLQEALAAQALLAAVPGLEPVPLEPDIRLQRQCAEVTRDTLGKAAFERLVEGQFRAALCSGATTFATLYHGCQRMLCVYEERFPVKVEHYLSLFAHALGIEYEDTYKKYRLWRDPERVLAEMSPCAQAHAIPLTVARTIVERTFPRQG